MLIKSRLNLLKELTIEPVVLLYYTTRIVIDLVNVNLYLQKSCRYDTSTEPNLDTPCDNEKLGIAFVSYINSTYGVLLIILTTVAVALASSWSDDAGKKVKCLIIIPIIGQICQTISCCLQSYFWHWSPMVTVFTNLFFQVISGGHMLFLNAVMMHIGCTSSSENRTMRTGILMASQLLCLPLGSGLFAILLHRFGFFYTYFFALIVTSMSLILAIFIVKDLSVQAPKAITILQFFNFLRLLRSFEIYFKKRRCKHHVVITLLLVIHVFVWFSAEGEKIVQYLYFRYTFKWNEQIYGFYLAYKLIGSLVGTAFCSVVLSKWLKIHDGVIGTLAGFFDSIAILCYYFCNESWQLYPVALLHIFQGTAVAVHYSFISKYFEDDEFGRLSCSQNILCLLVPISHPIYTTIFQNTLDTAPSSFYLVSLFFNVSVCLLYWVTYLFHTYEKINDKAPLHVESIL